MRKAESNLFQRDVYIPKENNEPINLPKGGSNVMKPNDKKIENKPENDNINHPAHYTQGKIETWDFILDKNLDYCSGNVIKYVVRADHKGNKLEDLKKAKAYLEKLICEEEKKGFI